MLGFSEAIATGCLQYGKATPLLRRGRYSTVYLPTGLHARLAAIPLRRALAGTSAGRECRCFETQTVRPLQSTS